MQTQSDRAAGRVDDWTFRVQRSPGGNGHVVVLVHGWKGDENSMWALARNLPAACTIVAPRAPYEEPTGGYTWRKILPGTWGLPAMDDLRQPADMLLQFVDAWSASAGVEATQFDLVGFSQGAALGTVLTLLQPKRIRSLVSLSGFLPNNFEKDLPKTALDGKHIFISHGRQDDLIPVERARQACSTLQACGAQVTYQETDGGHRISKEAIRGVEAFFLQML